MRKKRYIIDLTDGDQVDDLFMVKSARLGETRAGKPYLSLVFADRSGEIGGPAWDNAETLEKICQAGTVVKVHGAVQTYRDKLQMKVGRIEAVPENSYLLNDFVAASSRDTGSMESELNELIDAIGNPYLKELLNTVFTATDVGSRFLSAPAAKGIHHAFRGGLLEHSLSMARVASLLADHYPGVDEDLIVAGALLHDIGKTVELENEVGVIDYTDVGRLKGHLVIGSEFVADVAKRIEGFPRELLTHVQHLILSHHGRQEFGSPVVPMTAEGLLLCFIDDMDAKMSLVQQLRTKVKSDEPVWSDYQRSLERYLLLKPVTGETGAEKSTPEDRGDDDSKEERRGGDPVRQHSLF
jgi:3'-5' exoribonuclease